MVCEKGDCRKKKRRDKGGVIKQGIQFEARGKGKADWQKKRAVIQKPNSRED